MDSRKRWVVKVCTEVEGEGLHRRRRYTQEEKVCPNFGLASMGKDSLVVVQMGRCWDAEPSGVGVDGEKQILVESLTLNGSVLSCLRAGIQCVDLKSLIHLICKVVTSQAQERR